MKIFYRGYSYIIIKNSRFQTKCRNLKKYCTNTTQKPPPQPPPPPEIPEQRVNYCSYICGQLFGKYLLATNVISSGLLMCVGDFFAQKVENVQLEQKETNRMWFMFSSWKPKPKEKEIDLERLLQMFAVGTLQGPIHHFGYKWICYMYPARKLINTIKKILLDQFIMSPVCIVMFFYPACFLENKPIKEATQEVIEKFPFIYLMDWMTWPALQFINFHYLDAKYQVFFVNVVTALYDIFLSYVKHDDVGSFESFILRMKRIS